MEKCIYRLYIGSAPDCTIAATCPPGTGKSRRKDELGEDGELQGGMLIAVSAYLC